MKRNLKKNKTYDALISWTLHKYPSIVFTSIWNLEICFAFHKQVLSCVSSSLYLLLRDCTRSMCPMRSALPQGTTKSDLRSAFDVLDSDRDGKISHDDLRTFYEGRSGVEEGMIDSMMSVADSDKDGYVEYEEFERVLNGRRKGENGRMVVMEDAFRVMDRDGDGKVGLQDLKSYLGWAGMEARDEDVKAMIRLGGGDENGGVTFQGFLKILAV